MSHRQRGNSRPVYSTEHGRLCRQCQRPVADCVCGAARPPDSGDGRVTVQRQSKGRGGKTVTVIRGLPLATADLKALASDLKKSCGVGGAVKGDTIEIQGEQRAVLQKALEKRGYRVVVAGG